MSTEPFGWDNPAPGTMLWRLRNYPDTLTHEDAVRLAISLNGHIRELRAQVEALPIVDDFGTTQCLDRAAVLSLLDL